MSAPAIVRMSGEQRVTASRAKGEFGLDERDLIGLDCKLAHNPHYHSAANMRLYVLSDVRAASEAKKARAAAWEAGREERLEASRAKAKADARACARACAARVATLSPPTEPSVEGSTVLPVHVWTEVLSALMIHDVNPVRDACLAARDVCSAAMVCRDMRLAAVEVLRGAETDDADPARDARLARAVSYPADTKKPELKQACADLGLAVGGNKPELVVRILAALGLDALRRDAPVALLAEARRQRATIWREERSLAFVRVLPRSFTHSFGYDGSAWKARRALQAHVQDTYGYGCCSAILGKLSRSECINRECENTSLYAYSCCALLLCKECCYRAAASEAPCITHRHRIPERPRQQRNQWGQTACAECGHNTASPACIAAMCADCCPGKNCARHVRGRAP